MIIIIIIIINIITAITTIITIITIVIIIIISMLIIKRNIQWQLQLTGRKERHAGIPVASARLVDLQSLDDVGPWSQDKIFIKLHGTPIVMIMVVMGWSLYGGGGGCVSRRIKFRTAYLAFLIAWHPSNMLVYLRDGSSQTICACCHTEIEAADQTFQYTDTRPPSPSTDSIMPCAWQGSHWSTILGHVRDCLTTWSSPSRIR